MPPVDEGPLGLLQVGGGSAAHAEGCLRMSAALAHGLSHPLLSLTQQLVEEKRKALEATAPRLSLQQCLTSGNSASQQHAQELIDDGPLPSTVFTEGSLLSNLRAPAHEQSGPDCRHQQTSTPLIPVPPATPSMASIMRIPSPCAVAVSATPDAVSAEADLSTQRAATANEASLDGQAPSSALPTSYNGSECAESSVLGIASSLHRSSQAAQLRAMRLQQELLLREMEECTFHPRTNTARPPTKVPATEFFERSHKWKEEKLQEQNAKRLQLDGERMQECTFKPLIGTGPRGSDAVGASFGPSDVVKRLYQPQVRSRSAHNNTLLTISRLARKR
ncbi:MAG: hypothetical protein SGPRY_011916 [Prymnesium sp.]